MTGQESATTKFLTIRNTVRQKAVVYAEKVLPTTENLLKQIASYVDIYDFISFEEWEQNSDDLLSELNEAQIACELLRNMHCEILAELQTNENEATVGIELLQKMKDQYKREADELQGKASSYTGKILLAKVLGTLLIPVTLGWSVDVASDAVNGYSAQQANHLINSVARKENSEIVQQAVALTTGKMIPAIEDFMQHLDSCLIFVNVAKTRLERMKFESNKNKEIYFRAMKAKAKEVTWLCDSFVSMTDLMRIKMKTIPQEDSDKNYVDKWLAEQLAKFPLENQSIMTIVLKYIAKENNINTRKGDNHESESNL